MLEITNLHQGAILNHLHGEENDKSLRITVEGISDHGCPVTVNGIPARMDGRRFFAGIELTAKVNHIQAATLTPYGSYTREITVMWDKKSFKRYNFYIDDNVFLFTDLAKERPQSAFDHFYLKGLKSIHDKYGTKFSLNCFYHNAHEEFLLKDMPDIWKSEFMDNTDWLRFSFHSYSEFPDRPYAEASAEEFGHDWDLVQNEIIRFAGEAAFIPPCVTHWVNIHPAAAQEMIRRGTRCYPGMLRLQVMGGPSLSERQNGGNMDKIEKRSVAGIDRTPETYGLKLHYSFGNNRDYLDLHRCCYDPLLDLIFYANDLCCNLMPLENIPGKAAAIMATADEFKAETFGLLTHEQYTYPYYPNYLPDHLQRIECAVKCYSDAGCKPVFFNEGILGNTAWEK